MLCFTYGVVCLFLSRLHPESIEAAAAFVAARLNDPLLRSTLVDIGSTDDPVPHPQVCSPRDCDWPHIAHMWLM